MKRIYRLFVALMGAVTLISTVTLFGYLIYLTTVKGISVSYILVMTVMVCIALTIIVGILIFKNNDADITNPTEESK